LSSASACTFADHADDLVAFAVLAEEVIDAVADGVSARIMLPDEKRR